MSKIITKKDVDLVIENTLIEVGLVKETTEELVESVEETDVVTESVNNLVNEVKKENSINEGLSNELDNFKRFINYSNY